MRNFKERQRGVCPVLRNQYLACASGFSFVGGRKSLGVALAERRHWTICLRYKAGRFLAG